jgi:adenosylcobinamide-GDP ribazoletransferase
MLDALSFLTVFGKPRKPDARTLVWFGPVGAAIGATLGFVWWGASRAWSAQVAAGIVVTADLVLTGLLHMDGLADAADGLLPPLEPRRRLAVMAMPDVGAFGVVAVALALLLRFAALSAITPHRFHTVALLAGIWCASRTLMAVTTNVVPYARSEGLARAFVGGPPAAPLLLGLPLSALVLVEGRPGLASLAAGVAAGILVILLAMRRIGGFTGDVLGAAGVVTETVALVVASAKW